MEMQSHLLSPSEAGAVYRAEKLRDFEWQARCLGFEHDTAFCALMARIADASEQLEGLQRKQEVSVL